MHSGVAVPDVGALTVVQEFETVDVYGPRQTRSIYRIVLLAGSEAE